MKAGLRAQLRRKTASAVAAALAAALAVGCSSRPPASPKGPARWGQKSSVFVQHAYRGGPRGKAASAELSLVLEGAEGGQAIVLPLPSSERDAFAAAEPGVYRAVRVESAEGSWPLEAELSVPLVAQPGRISYLGRLEIALLPGKSPRIQFSSRASTALALKAAFARLPAGDMSQLSSAYSGRPIELEMLAEIPRDEPAVFLNGVRASAESSRGAAQALYRCAQQEARRNPAPIGALRAKAELKNGALLSFEASGANAFFPEFESCVREAAFADVKARRAALSFVF